MKRRVWFFGIFGVLIAVGIAAASSAQVPQPQPQPPPATPAPSGTTPYPAPPTPGGALPAPSGVLPAPVGASPAPSPSASPVYHYIWKQPRANPPSPFPGPNAPDIREIDLSDAKLVTPGDLRVRVLTSPDVISVVAHTLGRELPIPRSEVGVFGMQANVPQVPAFLAGRTYDVDFTAAVADGRTVTVTLQLGLE